MHEKTDWKKILPFVLVAACVGAFLPTLFNGFTNWDDQLYLTANPAVRSISPSNIIDIFTHFHRGLYKPLVLLSFAFEYHFFGLNPAVYHATNLILHICNALLAYWLLALLTGRRGLAFAAALLFAVHPLRVESVAWIAERKDMLASFFALLALSAHGLYRKKQNRIFVFLSCVTLTLSMLANAKAVMLPFIMVAMDIYAGFVPFKKSIRDSVPYFAITAFFAGFNYFALRSSATLSAQTPFSAIRTPFIAASGFLIYIEKTLLPFHLSALYPYPKGYPATLPLAYWLAPLAAAAVIWLFLRVTREDRTARFGGAFFALYLFPFLQWLPVQPGVAMEHLSYFPSIGLSLSLARFLERAGNGFSVRKKTAVFTVIILALCTLTWQRAKIWKNSFTLWNERIAAYPDSTVAHINRGMAYYEAGDMNNALADCTKTIELNPKFRSAYVKRGEAYFRLGKYEEAVADEQNVIVLSENMPLTPESLSNLAEAYFTKGSAELARGDAKAAEADFDSSLKALPNYPQSLAGKGRFRLAAGETALAIRLFKRAVEASPLSADLWNGLGAAQSAGGDYNSAVESYRRALQLNPAFAGAWFNWAATCLNAGDFSCADEKLQKSIENGFKPPQDFVDMLHGVRGKYGR